MLIQQQQIHKTLPKKQINAQNLHSPMNRESTLYRYENSRLKKLIFSIIYQHTQTQKKSPKTEFVEESNNKT